MGESSSSDSTDTEGTEIELLEVGTASSKPATTSGYKHIDRISTPH